MNHTKAPWKYLRYYEFHTVVDQERNLIASVRMGDQTRVIDSEEREANGRLIAAAPELLEALDRAHILIIKLLDKGYFGEHVELDLGFIIDVMQKAQGISK